MQPKRTLIRSERRKKLGEKRAQAKKNSIVVEGNQIAHQQINQAHLRILILHFARVATQHIKKIGNAHFFSPITIAKSSYFDNWIKKNTKNLGELAILPGIQRAMDRAGRIA